MDDLLDPAEHPVLTVREAAEVLRISLASAYTAVRTGELPVIRIGSRIVVPTAEVRRMLRLDPEPTSPP